MENYMALLERRSIRKYTSEPVGEQTLHEILRAGMYAPSAVNSQPWEFLVVTGRADLDRLSTYSIHWGMLREATAAIIVLANLHGYRSTHQNFFIQDCAACTQNMLIAAQGQGLGSVWLGLYPKEDIIPKVRAQFGIPEDIIPFSVVSLGVPNESRHPHTSFKEEKVHVGRY